MANYIVDPAVLAPYIPAKTELDVYNGKVYVSLIGFMFENTRLLGFKIPFHVNFEEVNLRFYVRYNDNGSWKRGVVFIKEIVPKAGISIVANTLYKEQYSTMRMKHFYEETAGKIKLGYHWRHRYKWNHIAAITENKLAPILPGSEAEFITEHYWGYSKYSEQRTVEYAVQHPRWQMYPVKEYTIDCDFTALYGDRFSMLQFATPNSVFVAKGSPISILHKKNL